MNYLICKKTMRECATPSMCAPFQGCSEPVLRPPMQAPIQARPTSENVGVHSAALNKAQHCLSTLRLAAKTGRTVSDFIEVLDALATLLPLIARVDRHTDADAGGQDAAVAAIQFALDDEDGLDFLRYWNEGEFDVIRRNWTGVPEAVFIGADPLHSETKRPTAVMAGGLSDWPEEPTPEMQQAGATAIRFETTIINKLWTANAVYRAMRAALKGGAA